jgi:hypothetical protein
MKGDHWWTKCPNKRNNSRNNDRNSRRRPEHASPAQTRDYDDEYANAFLSSGLSSLGYNCLIDSGCSVKMINQRDCFTNLSDLDRPVSITSALSDAPIFATQGGPAIVEIKANDGSWATLTLSNAVFVDTSYSLLFVGRLVADGFLVSFNAVHATIEYPNILDILSVCVEGVYPMKLRAPAPVPTSFLALPAPPSDLIVLNPPPSSPTRAFTLSLPTKHQTTSSAPISCPSLCLLHQLTLTLQGHTLPPL